MPSKARNNRKTTLVKGSKQRRFRSAIAKGRCKVQYSQGERFELETSNFACRLTTRGTNEKNAKFGQRGREGVMRPTFEILGPPPYLWNCLS